MSVSLDFNYFETNNLKTLGIQDGSIYDPSVPIVKPIIKVYIPGFTECSVLNFKANQINILNSNNLGLTDSSSSEDLVNLPDGIYNIEYSFLPYETYTVSKKIFRVSFLSSRFEEMVRKGITPCSDDKSYFNLLKKAEFYIYGAIANANSCNYKEAITLYNEAEKIIEDYLNECV